ncbi:MAG: heme lyase CcmF/NrfE family subunit [Alphaproteobacteria bacterium]|nr:heme lyase CcmF/NrfE family subunit [Alphaproteobacteria bacterium]
MIAELGHFALLLAGALAAAGSLLGLIGAGRGHAGMMAATGRAAYAQFACVAVAFAALTHAYVTSDFSLANVVANSHSAKPLLYKITGVWGNHEGSMLLWVLVLSFFGILIARFGGNLAPRFQARVLAVQALIGALFFAFIIFTSNPFLRVIDPPLDGEDLNPLLQDPGLAFHPPLLYLGYVGLSVTFAFAVAALIEGRVDAVWGRWVRPWTLVSWIALTMGIALGSWWAYYELGWGGWWFWDPVENASLMPWLAATALLHSAIVVERRETLKSWTVLLALVAFSLSLLGTFLVRSGVLTSVHAFANDPARGVFILAILCATIGGSLVLFAWRAPVLKGSNPFQMVSRESALLINNVLLTTGAATVFLGTLYPLAIDLLTGEKISVGPPFFERVFVPVMALLLVVVPFGPRLYWKRAEWERAVRDLWPAALIAILVALSVAAFVSRAPVLALLGVALGAWAIAGAAADLAARIELRTADWRRVMARARILPRSAWGGALAHGGLGVLVLGAVTMSVWQIEDAATLKPGETTEIAGFAVTLREVAPVQGPNYSAVRATIEASREGTVVATLHPERRTYPVTGMATTEAAIWTSGIGDLYAVIGEPNEEGGYIVRVFDNPLAPFLWAGALIMALGGLLSLSDRRFRIAVPGLRRAAPPAAAPAE